jgi:hypothetical protein
LLEEDIDKKQKENNSLRILASPSLFFSFKRKKMLASQPVGFICSDTTVRNLKFQKLQF